MSKYIILITNFQKSPNVGGSFDIGGLSLCNLAKLCFFKLIMAKSNIRKTSYDDSDIILMTSSQLVTEKRHKNFPFSPHNQNFWLRRWIKVIVISYFQSKVIVIVKI